MTFEEFLYDIFVVPIYAVPFKFERKLYFCRYSCPERNFSKTLFNMWIRGRPFHFQGGCVGDFWSARNFFSRNLLDKIIFFPISMLCRIFFRFSFICRIFFSSKRVTPKFCKMFLHLNSGYCSISPQIWSCKALKTSKLYNQALNLCSAASPN